MCASEIVTSHQYPTAGWKRPPRGSQSMHSINVTRLSMLFVPDVAKLFELSRRGRELADDPLEVPNPVHYPAKMYRAPPGHRQQLAAADQLEPVGRAELRPWLAQLAQTISFVDWVRYASRWRGGRELCKPGNLSNSRTRKAAHQRCTKKPRTWLRSPGPGPHSKVLFLCKARCVAIPEPTPL